MMTPGRAATVADGTAPRDACGMGGNAPKSLPLILARELAANLATPMFLMDAGGTIVFFNEAAEALIGKPFGEVGEISGNDFGAVLQLADLDGSALRRRDSPAGIAFFRRCPAHRILFATGYDGVRRRLEATAYPLFGTTDDMHGVVTLFWEVPESGGATPGDGG
jgi:PAS domain-containing protein